MRICPDRIEKPAPPGNGRNLRSFGVWSVFAILVLVGVLRIAATYPVLSQVLDEPASIACGMEWLDKGTYTFEPVHPPLARVMAAVGPFLKGSRLGGKPTMWREGNAILHDGGNYRLNLALARLGILPFFLVGTLVVFLWARELFGQVAALAAAGFFTTLPPVLAHSGFATLDMALTATVLLAFYCYHRLVVKPCFSRALFFGAACGFAVLSKFTAGVILAVGILSYVFIGALLVTRKKKGETGDYRPRSPLLIGTAILAAVLTIWAGYRFSFGPVVESGERIFTTMAGTLRLPAGGEDAGESQEPGDSILQRWSWPAPELIQGVRHAQLRGRFEDFSYLLGRIKKGGWWYFYPAVLLFKTPLPVLLLAGAGILAILRDRRRRGDPGQLMTAVYPAAILLAFLPSQVDNGVRQILVIYGPISILAALGAVTLFGSAAGYGIRRALAVGLVAWHLAGGIAVHPDYVAYFNELAGGKPENVLVPSDLDWGQDLGRLVRTVKEMGIKEMHLRVATTAELGRFTLPRLRSLEPMRPVTGWVAVSFWRLKFYDTEKFPGPPFGWLENYTPERRIGRSILLFKIPDEGSEIKNVEAGGR